MISLEFSFHWLSHTKSILVHLCEYKFTLKLHLSPSTLVTSLLLLLVLSVAVAHLTLFPVTLKSSFYVNSQFIWCSAFLPQIQAAFLMIYYSAASTALLENQHTEFPGGMWWSLRLCYFFYVVQLCQRTSPLRGTSRKLHLMVLQWEVGTLDPAERHSLAAKQIISTFKFLGIKSNYEILK